jgi:hypothetical protein
MLFQLPPHSYYQQPMVQLQETQLPHVCQHKLHILRDIRETQQTVQVLQIKVKNILRVQHIVTQKQTSRLRVIYQH